MIRRTEIRARRAIGVVATIAILGFAGAATFSAGSSSRYLGSAAGLPLAAPIVGIAATPSGNGYWLVATDGGVFSFGDAHFHGSTGAIRLAQPIVGIAPTPSGNGYWLVATDGGVFSFGDAHFAGSAAGLSRSPIVGIAATPAGNGYWLAAADGGVFTFGNAAFHGSAAGLAHAPIVGIAATPAGKGYWLGGTDGAALAFGTARASGTQLASGSAPVIAIESSPASGFWVAARDGRVGISNAVAVTPSGPPPIAQELLNRLNAERAARHLKPLAWNPLLASYASSWAHTLASTNQFRHQDLTAILNANGGSFSEVGENLFSGTGAAADAGTAHITLMASAVHRENILLSQGQLIGIGAACSGGKLVVVEDFAIERGAPLPPAGQPVPAANPVVSSNPGGAHC